MFQNKLDRIFGGGGGVEGSRVKLRHGPENKYVTC